MRKYYFWTVTAIVTLALSSCGQFGGGGGGGNNDPEFRLSDLQGLWLEEIANKPNVKHFVRFTDEKAEEAGYFLGREWNAEEWDDPDMTAEEYLIWNREQLGHPCNGWFQYQFEVKGDLHEIHFMDNGGAEIPKEYIVTVLSDTRLEYYEKDNKSRKTYFNKIVENKQ